MGKWCVCVIAAGLVGAAACSSGGSSHAASTNPAPASSSASASVTTSTTVHRSDAADAAIARTAQLTVSDLPAGWSARPAAGGADTSSQQVARCLGVDVTLVDTDLVPHDNAIFAGPDNGTVTTVVAVYPDVSTAQRLIDAYSTSRARECFRTFLASVLAFTPDATPISLGKIGDARVGMDFVFHAGPAGTRTISLLYARRGRVVCLISARLAPTLDSAALLAKMASRVNGA